MHIPLILCGNEYTNTVIKIEKVLENFTKWSNYWGTLTFASPKQFFGGRVPPVPPPVIAAHDINNHHNNTIQMH